MVRPVLLWLARLSLAYNAVILAAVVLDLDWVRSRAAGGSFTTFPLWIRAVYAVQAAIMIVLIWRLERTSSRWAKILAGIFAVSTVFQLMSTSPDERWNAIPAAILVVTYMLLAGSHRRVEGEHA